MLVSFLPRASAIWLRQELWTQIKATFFNSLISSIFLLSV